MNEGICGRQIFIIADDRAAADALARLFTRDGFQVTTFPDRSSLAAAAGSPAPACILLCLKVPEASKLEIWRELNARGCRAPTLVIDGRYGISAGSGETGPPGSTEDFLDGRAMITLVRM